MKDIHTIWSDDIDEMNALVNDIMENPEDFDLDHEDIDEGKVWDIAYDLNNDYLDGERINLNIRTNDIIAIGDIGRWNGRVRGYKKIGDNIKDCLYSDGDVVTWYCDRYNFRATEHHHDGTNYILYRERRDGVSDYAWDNFCDKLYYGKATGKDIARYTRSLRPYIANVYGWR